MEIFKTLVPSSNGLFLCDTIEYENDIWLVPEWLIDTPSKGFSKPAKIVLVTPFAAKTDFPLADYIISNPLPIGYFDGHIPQKLKNVCAVIENPDIVVEPRTNYH